MSRTGVVAHAKQSYSSPEIHHFVQGDELNVDRKIDRDGIVWLHHAHSLGADDSSPRTVQSGAKGGGDQRIEGDGQGWIPILSEAGHVQMQQMERRKPVRAIQAAGERSFAFTGDKQPLRRHLSQI